MLAAYWTKPEMATNGLILLNLLGALLLGLLVGYERSYHGRAAGMRTYGLVCMASCALTIVSGYPEMWFGGQTGAIGNVIDRLRFGYVVDFVQWYWRSFQWPVFNLADSCIVVGAVLMLLSSLGHKDKVG